MGLISSLPKILDRLVSQLISNGMGRNQAYAVATKKLQESGNLKKGSTEATPKGIARGNMTPAQRAKDRAAKAKGGKPSDYKYNSKNNSAVKGRVSKKVKARA
jgi:hypothetical protein